MSYFRRISELNSLRVVSLYRLQELLLLNDFVLRALRQAGQPIAVLLNAHEFASDRVVLYELVLERCEFTHGLDIIALSFR